MRAARLSRRDWAALAAAAAALLRARIALAARPAGALVSDLQERSRAGGGGDGGADVAELKRLAWAISAVAARAPWRSDCLVQVLAADRLLRRRGKSPEFFLGVARPEDGAFAAHAWLRCGGIVVAGGGGAGFTALIEPRAGATRGDA